MAFSFGFYNSLDGDRKYDAEDISRMFDGIITDGVIGAVGDSFAVKASTGTTVIVSSGRAWFDHTWSYNDAPMPVPCDAASVLLDRYDAIVLEVNSASDKRMNTIKVISGTESSKPVKPTMESTEFVHQYPLAYILRKAGSSEITQGQIENAVGTAACPICTGVLKSLNVDQMMSQWAAQFDEWFQDTKATLSDDVAGNLLAKIQNAEDKIPYMYTATLDVSGWTASSGTYNSNGYVFMQTATMVPDVSSAPIVTGNSIFTSGVQALRTGVPDTDKAIADALSIINDGITESGYNSVTVYVKKKPTASINARWQLTK